MRNPFSVAINGWCRFEIFSNSVVIWQRLIEPDREIAVTKVSPIHPQFRDLNSDMMSLTKN
jgi:hypothetical protein